MNNALILVSLTPEQAEKAKQVNGPRKRITHAVLCGEHGQIFGTEKQCLKYFNAWKEIFKSLFNEIRTTDSHEITDFTQTHNLSTALGVAKDSRLQPEPSAQTETVTEAKPAPKKKAGFWSRLFG